jgi:hypothetical protein
MLRKHHLLVAVAIVGSAAAFSPAAPHTLARRSSAPLVPVRVTPSSRATTVTPLRPNTLRAAAAAIVGAVTPLGVALAGTEPAALAAVGGTTSFGGVPFVSRCSYLFKALLVKRAVLTVLVFGVLVAVMGGLLFRLSTDDSFGEGTFRAYALLNNVPGADAVDGEQGPLGRLVSNVIYMVGVATFAVIIGIASDKISSSVESVRVSNERVMEVGHTVVVGWGEYANPMMRQLESARREGRLKGPVVFLSERPKEEMDEAAKEELGRFPGGAGLSVITRTGSASHLNDVDRVAAGTAQRIIVLPPEKGTDDDDAAASARDTTGLALSLQRGVRPASPEKRASVVVAAPSGYGAAEFVDGGSADGFGSYAEIQPEGWISRLLAQCAMQPSLSHVYNELLLQGAGCELYTAPVNQHRRSLLGKTFEEATARFSNAIALGVVQSGDEGGGEEKVVLAPPADMVLAEGDAVVLMARSRRDALPTRPRPLLRGGGGGGGGGAPAVGLESPSQRKAKTRTLAASSAGGPQRVLMLNGDPSMPDFIEQVATVLPRGSEITLLAPSRLSGGLTSSPTGLKHGSTFNFVRGDPTSISDLRRIGAHEFDVVVWMQPCGGSDADDAKLLVTLLSLQEAADASPSTGHEGRGGAAAAVQEGGPKKMPRIVGEVHSPSMLQLLREGVGLAAGEQGFVLPNELVSGILVQCALQPEVRGVYLELLSDNGKEIASAPASLYADDGDGGEVAEGQEDAARTREVTFEALAARARARGEVALGVRLSGEDKPRLNPPRRTKVRVDQGDQLIVLGDVF